MKITRRIAAGVGVLGLVALGVACGSSSNAGVASFGDAGEDSGFGSSGGSSSGFSSSSSSGATSSGGTSSSSSSGSEDAAGVDAGTPALTSALFVNAMPAGWKNEDNALRFCWSTDGVNYYGQSTGDGGTNADDADDGTTDEPFPAAVMPASNFAGVPLGGTALLSDATSLIDPGGRPMSLYAIRAIQLQNYHLPDTACAKLFPASMKSALQPNTDYFDLGTVSIERGASNIIVVDGCFGAGLSPTASTTSCGPSWDGGSTAGNLSVQSLVVGSSSAGDGGGPFVQLAQLSPGLAELLPEGGTATVSLATLGADGGSGTGSVQTIAQVSAEGQVFPYAPVALTIGGGLSSYANVGLRLDVAATGGGDAGALSLFLTLAQIQELADPTADPRVFYGAGGTYLLGIVGDPKGVPPFTVTPEGGTYDGTGLHFVFAQAQP
jgi:hypothetical protein